MIPFLLRDEAVAPWFEEAAASVKEAAAFFPSDKKEIDN